MKVSLDPVLQNRFLVLLTGFDEPSVKKRIYLPTSALSGKYVLGIAQTGSGKTCSFNWPTLVHIMDQRELARGEGPIALALVPTRELAMQIYSEARKYCKVYNIHMVCAYDDSGKYEQSKALEQGAEVAIATPGRMIDLIRMKVIRRVDFLLTQ